MTVDYTIGHEVILVDDGENEHLVILEEDFDVCDPELTDDPNRSLRQFSGYGHYWISTLLPTLNINAGEYPRIMPLSEVIDEIRALREDSFGKIFLPGLRKELSTPHPDYYHTMFHAVFEDMTPEEVEKEIKEMATPEQFKLHVDRVHWFQYWGEKCIREYGEDAKIEIS